MTIVEALFTYYMEKINQTAKVLAGVTPANFLGQNFTEN